MYRIAVDRNIITLHITLKAHLSSLGEPLSSTLYFLNLHLGWDRLGWQQATHLPKKKTKILN